MANITLNGNIGNQPELKTSQAGTSWARFSLFWTERVKTQTGQFEDTRTEIVNVYAYGKLAEAVAQLPKGCRVVVSGDIRPDAWDSQNGRREDLRLTATHVAADTLFQTLQISRGQSGTPQQPQQQQQQQFGQQAGAPSQQFGFDASVQDEQPPF